MTLVQRVLKSLPALFFILLPFVAGSSNTDSWFMLGFIAFYGAFALPLIVAQYLRFAYWITPAEIVIHSGVFTRRKRSIPLDRIQNIVIERSLLPRLLGTAKVKIETAGSKTTEGVLEYVAFDEAEKIRQVVRTYQQHLDTDAPGTTPAAITDPDEDAVAGPPPAAAPPVPKQEMLFTMALPRILLSGAFRFSLLYIALIFSGMQYVLDAMNKSPEDIAEWFVRGGLEPYTEAAQASPWLLGVVTIFLAALLGWVTGVVVNLNKYHGFRLWLEDDKLHRRHGLLTISEGTTPLHKVQALIVRSNPLMRRFGWYRLELQTMGYDVEQQGYQVAVPFAKEAEILALAPHIRRFAIPDALTPVSPIMVRRTFVRYGLALGAVLAPSAYYWRPALWGLALLPLLLYLAVRQYRNHGYALQDGILYIRRGVFQQYVWIVPVDKLQVFYTAGTLFQRRLGVRSVVVDTAGAGTFRFPQIVDVVAETADEFLRALYERFQAHFAPPAPTQAEP